MLNATITRSAGSRSSHSHSKRRFRWDFNQKSIFISRYDCVYISGGDIPIWNKSVGDSEPFPGAEFRFAEQQSGLIVHMAVEFIWLQQPWRLSVIVFLTVKKRWHYFEVDLSVSWFFKFLRASIAITGLYRLREYIHKRDGILLFYFPEFEGNRQ